MSKTIVSLFAGALSLAAAPAWAVDPTDAPRAGGRVVEGHEPDLALSFAQSPAEVATMYWGALTSWGCLSPTGPLPNGEHEHRFSCVRDGEWLSVHVDGAPDHAYVDVSAASYAGFQFPLDGDFSSDGWNGLEFTIYSAQPVEPAMNRYRAALEAAGCVGAAREWPRTDGQRWVCAQDGITYTLEAIPHETGALLTFFALDANLLGFPTEGVRHVAWAANQLDVEYSPDADVVPAFLTLVGRCEPREPISHITEYACERGDDGYLVSVGHHPDHMFVRVERQPSEE